MATVQMLNPPARQCFTNSTSIAPSLLLHPKKKSPTNKDKPSTNSYGDAAGFLAADDTNQQIVLSFRGSRTLSNWLANLNTVMVASSLCSGCEIHQGFWNDYQTVASTLKNQIDSAKAKYPGYALVITGHSLGGALAMICGTDLQNQGYAPTIVRSRSLSLSLLATQLRNMNLLIKSDTVYLRPTTHRQPRPSNLHHKHRYPMARHTYRRRGAKGSIPDTGLQPCQSGILDY